MNDDITVITGKMISLRNRSHDLVEAVLKVSQTVFECHQNRDDVINLLDKITCVLSEIERCKL